MNKSLIKKLKSSNIKGYTRFFFSASFFLKRKVYVKSEFVRKRKKKLRTGVAASTSGLVFKYSRDYIYPRK